MGSTALMCVCNVCVIAFLQHGKGLRNHILTVVFPQSSFPSTCLCVCLVPPHVISPSGQPPHQTSLQAVSRCHPSIWLCGMSQRFSREGCLTTIRLHPSPPLCLLPSALVSSFPNVYVCFCIFGNEWVAVFKDDCFIHTCGNDSCYNIQLNYKANCRFSWMKIVFFLWLRSSMEISSGWDSGLKNPELLLFPFPSWLSTGCPPLCLLVWVLWVSQLVFDLTLPSAIAFIILLYFLLHPWPGGWLELGLPYRPASTIRGSISLGLKGHDWITWGWNLLLLCWLYIIILTDCTFG